MKVDLELVKDELVNGLETKLTEDVKKSLLVYIHDHLLPIAQEVAQKYIAQMKEDSKQESGWCRFRDAIFLPIIIEGTLWAVDKILNKLISEG